jgi:hypothetical protein
MILESNGDITKLVDQLYLKIIKFKQKHPKSLILVELRRFQIEIIMPWMENYLNNNVEVDSEYDNQLKDEILDIINFLNKLS